LRGVLAASERKGRMAMMELMRCILKVNRKLLCVS
jgi:hypothetical protein